MLDATWNADPGAPDPPDLLARRQALLSHARALVGSRLSDIADGLGLPVPAGNVNTKGWCGRIIERELGCEEGAGRGPDFVALGVELKTVPVDEALAPLESTAVCVIDPIGIAAESWQVSHARRKLARVLFVALVVPGGRARRRQSSVGDRLVGAAGLWSPSPAEEELLRADFELFVRGYFRTGRATELTGHLGQVLQVRPKGNGLRDLRDAYDAQGRPIRIGTMGFYLRPAFVGSILQRLV